MRASDFEKVFDESRSDYHDTLEDYIESDAGRERIAELDSGWGEVMRACERNGFIIQAYGGTAIISTNRVYLEANGTPELARRLRMCNVDL